MYKKMFGAAIIFSTVFCAGCYKMPDQNHFSRVPLTNNPNVVPQKTSSPMPSLKY